MVMAAVAEQPPPPCFFSLPSSPSPSTDPHSSFPPITSSALPPRCNRSNCSPILPSARHGHAGTPLYDPQLTPFALPLFVSPILITLSLSRLLPPHLSISAGPTSLPWTRCYPRAIRAHHTVSVESISLHTD